MKRSGSRAAASSLKLSPHHCSLEYLSGGPAREGPEQLRWLEGRARNSEWRRLLAPGPEPPLFFSGEVCSHDKLLLNIITPDFFLSTR